MAVLWWRLSMPLILTTAGGMVLGIALLLRCFNSALGTGGNVADLGSHCSELSNKSEHIGRRHQEIDRTSNSSVAAKLMTTVPVRRGVGPDTPSRAPNTLTLSARPGVKL